MRTCTGVFAFFVVVGCGGTVEEPDIDDVVCSDLTEAACVDEPRCEAATGQPASDACLDEPEGTWIYFGCFDVPAEGACEGDARECLETDVGQVFLNRSCTYGLPVCDVPCGGEGA